MLLEIQCKHECFQGTSHPQTVRDVFCSMNISTKFQNYKQGAIAESASEPAQEEENAEEI